MELSAEVLHDTVNSIGENLGERRRHVRVPMRFKVKIIPYEDGQLGDSLYIWTRDISPGGIGIITPKRMREGKHFIMRLPRLDDTPVLLLCTVRACREVSQSIYNIGASFTEVAETLDSDLRDLAISHFQPELALKFDPERPLSRRFSDEIRRISAAILS